MPLLIILCYRWFKNRQKEAAALKIKAAASSGRVKLSALRRLFFFCRRPAVTVFNVVLVSVDFSSTYF